jgi:hypothetical protein
MIGGSSAGRSWEFSSPPLCPDWFWGPPNLLSNGYQGLFPWRWSGRGVMLTTHLHLVPTSKMYDVYFHSTNTPSWRGAQLREAQGQLYFTLLYFTLYFSWTTEWDSIRCVPECCTFTHRRLLGCLTYTAETRALVICGWNKTVVWRNVILLDGVCIEF